MAYLFPGESADLEAMLADSPHSITVGATTRPCFYDLRGDIGAEHGGAASQVLQIEVASIKADHFPAIAEDDAVTIAEQGAWTCNYTVLRVVVNGPLAELLLQKAAA